MIVAEVRKYSTRKVGGRVCFPLPIRRDAYACKVASGKVMLSGGNVYDYHADFCEVSTRYSSKCKT